MLFFVLYKPYSLFPILEEKKYPLSLNIKWGRTQATLPRHSTCNLPNRP